jgi:hypothetical protein
MKLSACFSNHNYRFIVSLDFAHVCGLDNDVESDSILVHELRFTERGWYFFHNSTCPESHSGVLGGCITIMHAEKEHQMIGYLFNILAVPDLIII